MSYFNFQCEDCGKAINSESSFEDWSNHFDYDRCAACAAIFKQQLAEAALLNEEQEEMYLFDQEMRHKTIVRQPTWSDFAYSI